MRRTFIAPLPFALLLLSTSLSATTPSLSLQTTKTQFLVGETIPLTLTINNVASEPLILATSSEDSMQALVQGLQVLVWDGARYVPSDFFCDSGIAGEPVLAEGHPVPTLTIGPNQCISRTNLSLFSSCRLRNVPAQHYRLRLSLSTEGRTLPKNVWQGSVQSPPLDLDLAEPQGEDKQYINELLAASKAGKISIMPANLNLETSPLAYHQLASVYLPELVASHPGCVFSAWACANLVQSALPGAGGPLVRLTPSGLQEDASRMVLVQNARDTLCSGKSSSAKERLEILHRLVEACQVVLKYHPNLEPAASLTRLNLATLLYVLGDTLGAKEQLEVLTKTRPDQVDGRAAKQLLDVISAPPRQQAPATK